MVNWMHKLASSRKQIDFKRMILLFIAFCVSAYIGYQFQPMISNNPNAVNTVVTIFSILAGFLIAVITFIAEPTLRAAKNWEELEKMKETVQRQLVRQQLLFLLYLLTLGIALAMYLTPPASVDVLKCLQGFFLFLATFVFLVSLTLPSSLMRIQMERYEAALEETRPEVIKQAKQVAKKPLR